MEVCTGNFVWIFIFFFGVCSDLFTKYYLDLVSRNILEN